MEDYDEYFRHAKLLTELHAIPKQLKTLESNTNHENIHEEKHDGKK